MEAISKKLMEVEERKKTHNCFPLVCFHKLDINPIPPNI